MIIRLLSPTPGFHLLKLTTLTDTKVDIVKVLVDNCDLRKLLYLSWLEPVVGKRIQPATGWWEAGQTWILPYGNPVSNWINQVERKILNGLYGKNLFDSHWFYYPTSTALTNHKYPQVIHDFFRCNFDFTIIPKDNFTMDQIPYMKYNKDIPKTLLDSLLTEIYNEADYIKEHRVLYSQLEVNKKEFGVSDEQEWTLFNVYNQSTPERERNKLNHLAHFPSLEKLVTALGMKYYSLWFGILPPGGFIYPHIDDMSKKHNNYKDFNGCVVLYIPLKWTHGNYIKFANAGIPDLDNGPMVINNDSFTHAAVNDTTETRYVMMIHSDHSILKDSEIINS